MQRTYLWVSLPDAHQLTMTELEGWVSVAVSRRPIVFLSAAEGLLIIDALLGSVLRLLSSPESIDAGQALNQNQLDVLLAWNAVSNE